MQQAHQNFYQQAHSKWQVQHVLTLAQKKEVVQWMVIDKELNGRHGLFSRTIQIFPEYF